MIVLSGTHSGQVITTTDARGSTVVLTYTPSGAAISELVLYTTRLPNGMQSTITSFAVVGAGGGGAATSTAAAGASAGASSSGTHGLQSALAAPTARWAGEIAVVVGGAMGVAALIL